MAFKKLRDLRFVYLARRHSDRHIRQLSGLGANLDSVPVKKNQGGDRTGSLIAIGKGMVLHDVKQICGCQLEWESVKKLSIECGAWLFDCRLEDPRIANFSSAAVVPYLVSVNLQHVYQLKEQSAWPAIEWTGRALLVVGREVPFADGGGRVAVVLQYSGDAGSTFAPGWVVAGPTASEPVLL